MDLILAGVICLLGGMVGGLVGVGGGAIFVPAMTVFIGLGQVEAEATSLLMIAFVSVFGTWRHRRYGNVDLRDAAVVGLLSAPGVMIGVVVANAVPERALRIGFAALALFMAWRLMRRAFAAPDQPGGTRPTAPDRPGRQR
ncbi:MAG: sulfite exporter TauE/SafE family protein [Solirubrobacterales bacterium]|nr:sulfite exporter TauE/SafE family protein [Solirubrobacterales bacterium]